jgi:hypothetical protein
MAEEIVFTLRLTSDDWDSGLSAWRCPAFDIPSSFIKEAFDPKGQPIAMTLLKIDKGPARVSWKGPRQPAQIALVVGLGEHLSLTSQEAFWKRFAIVVPIITALIGAFVTYVTRPIPPGPSYALRLNVYPNDIEKSGLPPAKIKVNGEELSQPIKYKIVSDVTADVDVNRAYQLAGTLKESAVTTIAELNAATQQVTDFTGRVSGSICGGGSSGIPSPSSGSIAAQGSGISQKLKSISSGLQATLATASK